MVRITVLCSVAATVAVAFVATPAQAGNCRDPWITQAIREVTGRMPNGDYESGECRYQQYRGGSWNNYAELKAAVQAKFNPLPTFSDSNQFAAKPMANVRARVDQVTLRDMGGGKMQFNYNGKWYWLVGNDGASLIGNDSAGLISNGTAPVVPTNAGNILSYANAALKTMRGW